MIGFSAYKSYFKDLAVRHKSIKHTDDDEKFFSMDLEDILASSKNIDTADVIMLLENYDGKLDDQGSDNIRDNQTGAFYILKPAGKNEFEEQDAAVDTCKSIAIDIVSHMRKDYRAFRDRSNLTTIMRDFDVSTVQYMRVGPLFNGFFGVRVEFSNGQQLSLSFDNSKWD